MHISKPEKIDVNKNEPFPIPYWEDIVQRHPFYAIAQFRLLVEYNQTKSEHFDRQAPITALFFCNVKWLNHQLLNHEKCEEKDISRNEPVSSAIKLNQKEDTSENIVFKKKDQPVGFEPMHLVDYFASQGIKITEELLTQDKLGTQLKSFTEWLQSMKKIHADKMPEGDEQTDKKIRNLAESSNANIQVITEAMAEVLLKQGKVEQAIELYEKLSLNYPPENAYFADKIKSLKSV